LVSSDVFAIVLVHVNPPDSSLATADVALR